MEEIDKIIPVSPPIVNRNRNPSAHKDGALKVNWDPCRVANQLKILIPVGTAIIMVADVK